MLMRLFFCMGMSCTCMLFKWKAQLPTDNMSSSASELLLRMQGVCRLLSQVKVYADNPDQHVSMSHPHTGNLQRSRALESHVEALEKQDVILAINRSHEYFDHKGMPLLIQLQLQRAESDQSDVAGRDNN